MDALTEKQQALIVKNLVAACKNIEKLNGTGYNFIYLASGFIAHYDINGFKHHYSDGSLRSEILENQRFNQWSNFRPGDQNYDYYMSKKAVYNAVVREIQ